MNFINTCKQNLWTAAGTMVGLAAGAAVHLARTGSFADTNKKLCLDAVDNIFISKIHEFREFRLAHKSNLAFSGGILLNPILPVLYVAPMIAFAIRNATKSSKEQKAGIKDTNVANIKEIGKNILIPTINSVSLFLGLSGLKVRAMQGRSFGVPVSGHVIYHLSLSLYGAKCLQELRTSGTETQRKAFGLMLVAVGVTDLVQMYLTAESCHSVNEIAETLGGAMMLFGCMEGAKSLCNKIYGLASNYFYPSKNEPAKNE